MLGAKLPYLGNEYHKHLLARNHEIYRNVYQNLLAARKKRNKHANKNAQWVDFQVNDPVFYKNYGRKSKFDRKWKPYFRVMEKLSDRSLLIKNQLDNQVIKCHVNQVRKANIADWELPENKIVGNRPIRNCRYVKLRQDTTNDSSSSSNDSDSSSSHSSQVNEGKARKARRRLIKRHRHVRENSSSEENIPLRDLQVRLRRNKQNYSSTTSVSSESSLSSGPESMTKSDQACKFETAQMSSPGRTSNSGIDSNSEMTVDDISYKVNESSSAVDMS